MGEGTPGRVIVFNGGRGKQRASDCKGPLGEWRGRGLWGESEGRRGCAGM